MGGPGARTPEIGPGTGTATERLLACGVAPLVAVEPGAFDLAVLDVEQMRGLYATFSSVNLLPPDDRERLLDAVCRVGEREFGGQVERKLVTPIYTARRRGGRG